MELESNNDPERSRINVLKFEDDRKVGVNVK